MTSEVCYKHTHTHTHQMWCIFLPAIMNILGNFEQMKMIILLMYVPILSSSETNHKPDPVQNANK